MTKLKPVVVRPATRADMARFYGDRDEAMPTVVALVGEVDGRLVGIGGVARFSGRRVAFCDLTGEGRRYRVALVKAARRLMDRLRRQAGRRPITVVARADDRESGARRWLTSLGFQPVPDTKGTFRWQA